MARPYGRWMVAFGAAALCAAPFAGAVSRAAGVQVAQNEPQLPGEPPPIGPLHRDANGNIEVIDPTKELGKGISLCDKGTICVGKNQAYATLADALAAAREGDTVEVVGGTYREAAAIRAKNVTVRGVAGRPHFDCSDLALAGDKACLLIAAENATLENLEISGAQLPDSLGANGACIRNNSTESFTLREVICYGSQEGLLSGGGTILIENSEFYDNGWNDRTHNVYLSGDCTATVRGSIFRDARVGHELKSRCSKTEISDSTFRSTKGSRDIDVPDGGETVVYRSTLVKTAGAQSDEIVGFAAESCPTPGDMLLKDVRIQNSYNGAVIHNFDKCQGHAVILEGVTFEGLPVMEQGYILKR